MKKQSKAVVIGGSAGGMQALAEILPVLPFDFALPVVVVVHVQEGSPGYLATYLNNKSTLRVKEANDKEPLEAGTIYIAPAGYHLLLERDETLALSVDAPVHFARPSIDVLFESAADVYGDGLIGVILTGANSDGSQGLKKIKEMGGIAIAQDPDDAEVDFMPRMAIQTTSVDHILPLKEIGHCLERIAELDDCRAGEIAPPHKTSAGCLSS